MTQSSSSASPSPAPQASLGTAGRDRVATVIAAEHAAIYGYGVLGPRLAHAQAGAAHTAETAHRRRRDQLSALLKDGVPAAAAAYATPAIPDAAAAAKLAQQIEERVTAAYRAALSVTDGAARKIILDGMVDAATRATAWRGVAGATPTTVPFPGRP
jgi:hypothetical protein